MIVSRALGVTLGAQNRCPGWLGLACPLSGGHCRSEHDVQVFLIRPHMAEAAGKTHSWRGRAEEEAKRLPFSSIFLRMGNALSYVLLSQRQRHLFQPENVGMQREELKIGLLLPEKQPMEACVRLSTIAQASSFQMVLVGKLQSFDQLAELQETDFSIGPAHSCIQASSTQGWAKLEPLSLRSLPYTFN